jgi:MraZ protein
MTDETGLASQQVARFMGTFEQSLDDRGRLILPAKFRERLGEIVVVVKGRGKYLLVFPLEAWEAISRQMDALSVTSEEDFSVIQLLYSFASDEEIDRQGRILIPANLRGYANLKDSVVVEGLNTRFAIWDKANWDIQARVTETGSSRSYRRLDERGIVL